MQGQGKLKEAIAAGEELLPLDEALFGKDHQQYLATLSTLGNLYQKAGIFPCGKAAAQVSDRCKKLHGDANPAYIDSLIVLGRLQKQFGRSAYSEYFFAWRWSNEPQEKKDVLYASVARELGAHFMGIGMYQRAEPLLKETLGIRKAILGPAHRLRGHPQ